MRIEFKFFVFYLSLRRLRSHFLFIRVVFYRIYKEYEADKWLVVYTNIHFACTDVSSSQYEHFPQRQASEEKYYIVSYDCTRYMAHTDIYVYICTYL